MARMEGKTLRMDDYEFTQFMTRGVISGQFTFGLLTGGVCFIVLSLFAWGAYLEDNGLSHLLPSWLGFFHLIPWIILVSLLFALYNLIGQDANHWHDFRYSWTAAAA